MATFADLSLKHRLFMKSYRYRSVEWTPAPALEIPLSQMKPALVTTAAFYLPGQAPFDEDKKGGDFSYREIPLDADLSTLRIGHRSAAFDASGIEKDPNLALPLQRLKELARQGVIGTPSHRHFSFMGSITAPGRLISETAPQVAAKLQQDGVNAVILTPV